MSVLRLPCNGFVITEKPILSTNWSWMEEIENILWEYTIYRKPPVQEYKRPKPTLSCAFKHVVTQNVSTGALGCQMSRESFYGKWILSKNSCQPQPSTACHTLTAPSPLLPRYSGLLLWSLALGLRLTSSAAPTMSGWNPQCRPWPQPVPSLTLTFLKSPFVLPRVQTQFSIWFSNRSRMKNWHLK